jgi:hypothetical protein
MKLVTRLDSRRAKIGDDVVLRLTKSLTADGATVLPADWVVHGHITDVKRAGKNCQPGSIHWELGSVTMTDGSKVEIQWIANDVALRTLAEQASKNTPELKEKTGTSVGGILKVIVFAPLTILLLSAFILSDIRGSRYDETCPGGKGKEESISAGSAFYAEIANGVEQVVD